jgi:hypothetical protein
MTTMKKHHELHTSFKWLLWELQHT